MLNCMGVNSPKIKKNVDYSKRSQLSLKLKNTLLECYATRIKEEKR